VISVFFAKEVNSVIPIFLPPIIFCIFREIGMILGMILGMRDLEFGFRDFPVGS
jgi:hypothetical protein